VTYVATIQIVLIPSTHTVDDPEADAARYRIGDPCNVLLTEAIQKATGLPWAYYDGSWKKRTGKAPKNGYIHVTGIPDSIPFLKLKSKVLETDWKIINAVSIPPTRKPRRRRRFRVPLDKLPSHPKIDKLLATQEVTVSFTALKNFMRRKTVSNDLNQSLDNEDALLTSGDFE